MNLSTVMDRVNIADPTLHTKYTMNLSTVMDRVKGIDYKIQLPSQIRPII